MVGYITEHFSSNPKTKVYSHIPKIKIKPLELFPSVKFTFGNKIFHLHHWMSYSILLIITIAFEGGGIFDILFIKGFLFGGAIQGFTFPDWKKIVYPKI